MITWVSLPARDNPKGIFLVLGSILLSIIGVCLLTLDWGASRAEAAGWAIAAGLLLTIQLRTFFLRTRYRLDDQGIVVHQWPYTRKCSWSRCKSLHEDRYGVLLSPFGFPTRLENFRGIFLRFAGNREEVMEFCRSHMAGANDTEKHD